jgi:hypothetical protein
MRWDYETMSRAAADRDDGEAASAYGLVSEKELGDDYARVDPPGLADVRW